MEDTTHTHLSGDLLTALGWQRNIFRHIASVGPDKPCGMYSCYSFLSHIRSALGRDLSLAFGDVYISDVGSVALNLVKIRSGTCQKTGRACVSVSMLVIQDICRNEKGPEILRASGLPRTSFHRNTRTNTDSIHHAETGQTTQAQLVSVNTSLTFPVVYASTKYCLIYPI